MRTMYKALGRASWSVFRIRASFCSHAKAKVIQKGLGMDGSRLAPGLTAENEGSKPGGFDTTLTAQLVNHLERTSLVDFGNEEALSRLRDAIEFADVLFEVNTTGVEPMTSVLDDTSLRLREDVPVNTSRDHILMNATITEEDYFVSPPGNIPLELSNSKIDFPALKTKDKHNRI